MNNKLIYAKDNSNNLIIINLEDLEELENLEGANVFKMLFFKNKKLKKDKDGCITILKELNIKSDEWYTLIRFLKSNNVNLHNEFRYNNEIRNLSKLIKNVEELYQISIKLGGFPKIDQYYKNFWKQLHNKKSKIVSNKRKREEAFDLFVGHCC